MAFLDPLYSGAGAVAATLNELASLARANTSFRRQNDSISQMQEMGLTDDQIYDRKLWGHVPGPGIGPMTDQERDDAMLNMAMDVTNPFPGGAALKTVFHGTPNKWIPEPRFPNGRPRLDKIGSGEGAQVYGHGIYFAENPAVARSYANDLGTSFSIDGRPYLVNNTRYGRHPNQDVDDYLVSNLGDIDKALAEAQEDYNWLAQNNRPSMTEALETLNILSDLKARGAIDVQNVGSVYSLDLPDDYIDALIDLDTQLTSQQHIARKLMPAFGNPVANAIGYVTDRSGNIIDLGNRSGMDVLSLLSKNIGSGRPDSDLVAKHMSSVGIPGAKYLDQGSRSASDGTRNYVIWDQSLLDSMPILGAER